MRYIIACVGRKAKDPLLEVVDEYVTRLSRYVQTELVRVREGTLTEERDALLAKVPPHARLVALDERGKEYTSMDLAKQLASFANQGLSLVAFVIGGADGLHKDVVARAQLTMSLSRLTLPHRLAQVLLAEQLYRAHTILRGEPYHRP